MIELESEEACTDVVKVDLSSATINTSRSLIYYIMPLREQFQPVFRPGKLWYRARVCPEAPPTPETRPSVRLWYIGYSIWMVMFGMVRICVYNTSLVIQIGS